jgi:hypothetical protein
VQLVIRVVAIIFFPCISPLQRELGGLRVIMVIRVGFLG